MMNPSTILSALSLPFPRSFARLLFALLLPLMLLPSPLVRAQAGAGAQPGVQREAEVRTLKVGEPVERELAGGQQHVYQITLNLGQYMKGVVEQRGIDLAVALAGPDGKSLTTVDGESKKDGTETLEWVAATTGSYQLRISARKVERAARYKILITDLRAATDRERTLQEARELNAEILRLARAGKYQEAISLGDRAVRLNEMAQGPDHISIAGVLNTMAVLCQNLGEYERAGQLHQRTLAIREKAFGPIHPEVAKTLLNYGVLAYFTGDYVNAEMRWQRALMIKEQTLGTEHPELEAVLINLASLFEKKGDHEKVEALYQRALMIAEKAYGPDDPQLTSSLSGLGNVYQRKGDLVRAEAFHQRSLKITEHAYGPEHNFLVDSLFDLGDIHRTKGEYGQAEPLFRRALAIMEKTYGPEHPGVATNVLKLANLYHLKGDYAQAESFFQRGLAIWEKKLGPEHPNLATALTGLAKLAAAKGDMSQALIYQSRAVTISERNIAYNMVTGSERQKLAYLQTLSGQTERTISLHASAMPQDARARDLALTAVFQRKGRALEAMTDSLSVLRRQALPEDQVRLDQLKDLNSRLAKLALNGPQKIKLAEHLTQIKVLEEQKEKLEAEISHRSAAFRSQMQPVTLATVQAELPETAALVEFAIYRPFNARYTKETEIFAPSRYIVYVLHRQGEAQWVDLGDQQNIDKTIRHLRFALRDKKRADVKQLARALDEKVMRPVRALLGKTRRVLIAPDGALNLIPFAALVDEKGRYLVQRYEFSYLTSGRDLLRFQGKQPNKQGAMVIANPDFGDEAKNGDTQERILKYRSGAKDETREGGMLSEYYFPPLEGTAAEARALKTIMTDATMMTQAQATEAALKQASSPRILHIATHGFFLEDLNDGVGDERELKQTSFKAETPVNQRIENPLLRSGLALAGANRLKSGDDDGILTAQEAAGLDLWGTKLVVLSACDTGVGEVKNGEGVYGLRRALVLAGSETQVMSLWPVSDKGTRDLMIEYYRRLLKGEGRSAALRQVQLQMLKAKAAAGEDEDRLLVAKSQQDKGRVLKSKNGKNSGERSAPPRLNDYSHPYYWASFIQSGEWANLDGKR